jgi:hypothetical protein
MTLSALEPVGWRQRVQGVKGAAQMARGAGVDEQQLLRGEGLARWRPAVRV